MKRVLGVDPGHSTGYALVEVDIPASARVVAYGHLDVDHTSEYAGDHCLDLQRQLLPLLTEEGVTHVVIEDYYFSSRTATGASVNAAYRAAVQMLARQYDIPYTVVGITEWRQWLAGSSKPTKAHKAKWGLLAVKVMIQDALWRKCHIRFPNHSVSNKTGKPIGIRYDCIDAVGQVLYWCHTRGVSTECMSCEVGYYDVIRSRSLYVYEDV